MRSAPFCVYGESMSFPIIGISTYQGINNEGHPITALQRAYVDAITQAGGIPLLIPNVLNNDMDQVLLNHLDGIMFTGGGDIANEVFNGIPHPRVGNIDLERDSLELSLLESTINEGKPFLGICRGFQVLVVGLGGSLYTHIEDQMPGAIKHDYYPNLPRTFLAHKVKIENGSRLASILGAKDISVNSLHHQGAKDIPAALKAVAYSPDGLVEAVELPNHPFFLGIQWHPEWLIDQPETQHLFRSFIAAANNRL